MGIEFIDICRIKPAAYNPRKISDEQLNNLRNSIRENGLVIPVIVNKNNMVIVAGHQRTRAAIECGLTSVPVMFV